MTYEEGGQGEWETALDIVYEPLEDDYEVEEVADSPRPMQGRGRGGRRGRAAAVANMAQYGYNIGSVIQVTPRSKVQLPNSCEMCVHVKLML